MDHLRQPVDRQFTVAQGKDDPDPGGVGEHGKHLHGQFHVLAVRFTTTYAFICIHTQVISQSPTVSEHPPHRSSKAGSAAGSASGIAFLPVTGSARRRRIVLDQERRPVQRYGQPKEDPYEPCNDQP